MSVTKRKKDGAAAVRLVAENRPIHSTAVKIRILNRKAKITKKQINSGDADFTRYNPIGHDMRDKQLSGSPQRI